MTQIYAIAGIIILAGALICFAYIRQTVVKRRKEKKRLHRALDKRVKDLINLLNAFPDNFLPRDLSIFLHRCILDVYEQLVRLEPSDLEYKENLEAYASALESVTRTQETAGETNFQKESELNETRQLLTFLGRFLDKWMERGSINKKQYAHYRELLKKLTNQIRIDSYIFSARQSSQLDKAKLAAHNFELAKAMLEKESIVGSKQTRLNLIQSEMEHINQLVQHNQNMDASLSKELSPSETEEDKEWKQFDEDANWKKKNLYD